MWNIWRRIFEVNDLILVDIGNKLLALVIKGLEKLRFLAVTAVNPNPGKSQPKGAGVMDDIKGKLRFCFEMHIVWNAGAFAPLPIFRPLFRKVKPGIDKRCRCIIDQRGKDTDLAIVDFAKASAPLPSDADRHLPLFGEACFVDNQAGVWAAAEVTVAVQGDLIHDRTMVPRRC